MKIRMYHYLITFCEFRQETLDLLNFKNLKQLATEYGFKF
jgi:hypothetical protein